MGSDGTAAGCGLRLAGAWLCTAVLCVHSPVFAVCSFGGLGFWKLLSFREYRAVNQALLADITSQMDTPVQIVKKANENAISGDAGITSKRRGFEYLNELFVKRHKKILWNSTKRISYICLFLVLGVQLFLFVQPEMKAQVNAMIMTWLPYLVFIMYAINRGTNFTQALFMNCDHSLLTYAFFKRPDFVLKLFQIRLREIMKINAVPALVIGGGMALTLYTSGGTENWPDYVILLVSVLCMSLFFFCALSDGILSASALQCGDGDEERNLPHCDECDVSDLFLCDAAADPDPCVWDHDYCVRCTLLYCCKYSGLSAGSENL